jgi:glutathione S-transferase
MVSETYTLYHNPYSICSLMVRQTVAIRGQAKDKDSEIPITNVVVDIFKEEQFSEHFLCEINPLGQVEPLSYPSQSQRVHLF